MFAFAYKGARMRVKILMTGVFAALLLFACTAGENNFLQEPVAGITILHNREKIQAGGVIEIVEGQSIILGALLEPAGIQGGVHWQSSNHYVLDLSGSSGQEITITGMNGGGTVIMATVRNSFNEVPVFGECKVSVIPKSFFKWDYYHLDWESEPVLEPRSNHYLMDAGKPMLIRTGDTEIYSDRYRGGIVLEGSGARLVIGSGMATLTNSPFSDDWPFDRNGQFNFQDGPSPQNPLRVGWQRRARICVDYEILDTTPGKSLLRIQVNNNSSDRYNASVINNSLVAELSEDSPLKGTLSGIFDSSISSLTRETNPNGAAISLFTVLRNSFVCLALPDGKILIRAIRITSAD
jgi:hypothetical protein